MTNGEDIEEVSGYLRTQIDCTNCGDVWDVEGDATGDILECPQCKAKFKIVLVR